jgi:hypothetical protein
MPHFVPPGVAAFKACLPGSYIREMTSIRFSITAVAARRTVGPRSIPAFHFTPVAAR